MTLQDHSIIAWIRENDIRNEKGDKIEFFDHPYLYDIYLDESQLLVVVKCAQCGLSTCSCLKNHYDAKHRKMDIIYTLPTDSDVPVFVGGKVNRIIANNTCMAADVADKDSIEQKAIGRSMIYYRGTWTAKKAIMITADRLVHDEKDSSNLKVVHEYKARLDSPSSLKQIHTFSHPSYPGSGVDEEWRKSDQKEWVITCPACAKEQYLSWSTTDPRKMSVDLINKEYVCKRCHAVLSDDNRRKGKWVAKYRKDEKHPYSGYHISQLMSPRISAKEIAEKWQDVLDSKQTEEYFTNKVLGLPYSGSGNVVTQDLIMGNVTQEPNLYDGRLICGVDTGIKLRYVIGNKAGLLGFGEMSDYEPHKPEPGDPRPEVKLEKSLEYFLVKFPKLVMVIDQGGDIIGSRKLQKKYPGRVFLCFYKRDAKGQKLIRWGDKDEFGSVIADRNRMMQLVIDEFKERRIPLQGTENDWYDYWLHWSHIYRTEEVNGLGVTERVWCRNDRDDWCHATIYWRIGIDRFGTSGAIISADAKPEPNSYMVHTDDTVDFNPDDMFKFTERGEDWRSQG